MPDRAYPAIGVVAVLVLFELLARTDVVPNRFFPPVSQMFAELARQVQDQVFWTAMGDSVQGWAIGLLVAIVIGVPLGLLIGSNIFIYRGLRPIIEFLRPIPSVALIPLAILIYGRGMSTKVFLIVFAAAWPLLIQAMYGVREVDPLKRDAARSFGLTRWERIRHVVVPSAMPYLATGVRIASATALVLSITAELVVGAPGIGREILLSESGNRIDRMYAYVLAAGLLGWGLNSLIVVVEARLLRWHPAYRKEHR